MARRYARIMDWPTFTVQMMKTLVRPSAACGQGSVAVRVLHPLPHGTPEHIDADNDLKQLRSRAVHDTAFSPGSSSVWESAALAKSLAAALRPLIASTPQALAAS